MTPMIQGAAIIPRGEFNRRDAMKTAVGSSLWGLLGSYAPWLGAVAADKAKAKRVIMIFNCGGPSHIDLWDPKPEAPSEIRGPFSTIPTKIPGVRFTELIPNLARIADKLCWIRTVHHQHTQHNSAMTWSITGRPYRLDSTLIHPSASDLPSLGTVVGHLAGPEFGKPGTVPYVITPFPSCDSYVYLSPGQFGGCLGREADPLILNLDPRIPYPKFLSDQKTPKGFQEDIHQKITLWQALDRESKTTLAYKIKAKEFLGDSPLRTASRLNLEPESIREKYGRHPWGESHLLARRLLEAGTRFVSVINGPSITWDTHKDNFSLLKNRLVPPMEKAFVALVEDLIQRGLWDDTLILSLSDFGRTPKINTDAGRDHWPQCFSAILGGGALVSGSVVGTSDRTGALPKDQPHTPADLHATILTALGHNPEMVLKAKDGRPFIISEGKAITQILQ